MSSIGVNLPSSSVQQSLLSAIQNSGLTQAASTSSSSSASDSSQLSGFAKIAVALQQLQESDPTKYKQVTSEIAANLSNAAQTATSQGNSSAAKELTQLASDFSSASSTGQLPNFQDLSQATGGGHGGHHHHHHAASSSDSSSSSTAAPAATSTTSTSASGSTLNAASIIQSTLTSAGISLSGN
jgi:hypothetical protein